MAGLGMGIPFALLASTYSPPFTRRDYFIKHRSDNTTGGPDQKVFLPLLKPFIFSGCAISLFYAFIMLIYT